MQVELIAWPDLSPAQQVAVRALQVSDQQVEYAGTIGAALVQCQAQPPSPDVAGLALMADGHVVGFLVLNRGEAAPKWAPAGAAVVNAMRVDAPFQGRGYGTLGLLALPKWVQHHWPAVQRIDLSVDEENSAAIHAYAKAGWADVGTRVQGRIGWVRYMSRPVDGASA